MTSTKWTLFSVIPHLSLQHTNVSHTQVCHSDLVLTFLHSLSKIVSFSGVTHIHSWHMVEYNGLAISVQIKTWLRMVALLVPETPPGLARAVIEPVSQLDIFLCPVLLLIPPFHRCQSQGQSLMNTLHIKGCLRVGFLWNRTCNAALVIQSHFGPGS